MFDVRIKGATVLETTSEFDACMKIQELIENGMKDRYISVYWGETRLDLNWRAEVSINFP